MDLVAQLNELNKQNKWWQPAEPVLVAVSTGVDSMVLLDLLQRVSAGPRVIVAHVNHQLRDQSQQEEQFLREYCEQRNLPLVVGTWPIVEHPQTGTEEAARRFRYAFFREQLTQQHVQRVLTAHHQSDQVETVLMRLVRGGQLSELTGMQAKRPLGSGVLERPLLTFSKEQLTLYAQQQGLTWFEDDTNHELTFTRNRYRHQIIPALRDENSRVDQHVQDYAQQLSSSLNALSTLLQPGLQAAIVQENTARLEIDLQVVKERLPVSSSVWVPELLTHHLKMINLNRGLLTELERLADQTTGQYKQLDLPLGWMAIRNYHQLVFAKKSLVPEHDDEQTTNLVVKLNQWCPTDNGGRYGLFSEGTLPPNATGLMGTLRVSESQLPLMVRPIQAGDVIAIQGGHQKVNRTLINQKVPRSKRERLLVLVSKQHEVLAILGVRLAYQESAETADGYKLFYQPEK